MAPPADRDGDTRPYTGVGRDGHGLPGPAIVVSLLTAVERTGVFIPDGLLLRSLERGIESVYDPDRRAYLVRIADTLHLPGKLIVPGEVV